MCCRCADYSESPELIPLQLLPAALRRLYTARNGHKVAAPSRAACGTAMIRADGVPRPRGGKRGLHGNSWRPGDSGSGCPPAPASLLSSTFNPAASQHRNHHYDVAAPNLPSSDGGDGGDEDGQSVLRLPLPSFSDDRPSILFLPLSSPSRYLGFVFEL